MDILCVGIVVVDHRRRIVPAADAPPPLRIVGQALELELGGVPIVAVNLVRMGLRVGVMGAVGADIAGYGVMGYLRDGLGIDTRALAMIRGGRTAASFIGLTDGERLVEHSVGVGAGFVPDAAQLELLHGVKPALVAIGYAGLLPALDADGGEGMAGFIRSARAADALVALDTHTFGEYPMLRKPLPLADVFICNREEGAIISGLGIAADPEAALAAVWRRYPADDPGRFRLFGVAYADGLQLAYGNGRESAHGWIPNPHYGAEIGDLTGAGDSLRAGIYAAAARNPHGFRSGRLDWRAAGGAGHDSAAAYLRRERPAVAG
jgi:sugar/nucleoside kinase (ribokinase family)